MGGDALRREIVSPESALDWGDFSCRLATFRLALGQESEEVVDLLGCETLQHILSDDSMAWSSWSASVSVILSAGSAGSSDCVGSAGSIDVVRRSDRRVASPQSFFFGMG